MWNWFLAQVGIFDSTLAFMSSLFSVTQFLGFFFFFDNQGVIGPLTQFLGFR